MYVLKRLTGKHKRALRMLQMCYTNVTQLLHNVHNVKRFISAYILFNIERDKLNMNIITLFHRFDPIYSDTLLETYQVTR